MPKISKQIEKHRNCKIIHLDRFSLNTKYSYGTKVGNYIMNLFTNVARSVS